jgi:hypothetical protein
VFITITIKMEAESKEELSTQYPSHVQQCRKFFDDLAKQGTFGEPEHSEIRYLIIGERWRTKGAALPEVDAPVQEHGTPDVGE